MFGPWTIATFLPLPPVFADEVSVELERCDACGALFDPDDDMPATPEWAMAADHTMCPACLHDLAAD